MLCGQFSDSLATDYIDVFLASTEFKVKLKEKKICIFIIRQLLKRLSKFEAIVGPSCFYEADFKKRKRGPMVR